MGLIRSCVVFRTASAVRCRSIIEPFIYQLLLKLPATSLPRKVGSPEAAIVRKPLKRWSGRRGSNPRDQLGKHFVPMAVASLAGFSNKFKRAKYCLALKTEAHSPPELATKAHAEHQDVTRH